MAVMTTVDTAVKGLADLDKLVGHYERTLLGSALQMAGGNKTEAARLLGITFRSLRHRVQKL